VIISTYNGSAAKTAVAEANTTTERNNDRKKDVFMD
jgi:hypothetical protein